MWKSCMPNTKMNGTMITRNNSKRMWISVEHRQTTSRWNLKQTWRDNAGAEWMQSKCGSPQMKLRPGRYCDWTAHPLLGGNTTQTIVAVCHHANHMAALAFLFDEYTDQMGDTTMSAVDQAREQLTSWLEVENCTMEMQVCTMVRRQIDAHIENCWGVIWADLDSIQPAANKLMQELLQDGNGIWVKFGSSNWNKPASSKLEENKS